MHTDPADLAGRKCGMSLRNPLARVHGLGSAGQGTGHWWYQRLTAIALVPLTLWIMISVVRISLMDHAAITEWMSAPLNTILLLLFIPTVFYHAQLGIQVVIEDYIDPEWQKISCIILVKFLALIGVVGSVLAVLKVFLGMS